MSGDVTLEAGEFGPRAVIHGPWSPRVTKRLVDHDVVDLELNMAKGWVGSDLSFLTELPFLKAFSILDLRPSLRSIEPIHSLHELRSLGVETYCKSELRFSAFPKLESCGLRWRRKATSLFDCGTLKRLSVDYKGKDTAPFARLRNLETLQLMTSPVEELHGLAELTKLRSLHLRGMRCMRSLAGIENLTTLEEFELQSCRRVTSIADLSRMSRLRILFLNDCGDIESLAPLNGLTRLENVIFYGSTKIVDGDLAPLARQRNLTRLAFRNRRHYSHRREDFEAYRDPEPIRQTP